jgi:hypothetical protein
MAKLFRTREGSVTTVDARTQLTTVGSETAPGPLLVPQGMKYITGLIVSHIASQAVATGYSAFVRLEGPGLPNGPEAVAIGAGGNAVATGGNAAITAVRIPVNFPVTPANEILLFGEMAGTDVGQLEVQITLEFSDALPAGAVVGRTFTVEGDITAADTKTNLTTQGSVTAPSPVVPSGVKKIIAMVVAATAEGLADGFQSIFVRLGGNAVLNGEQVIAVGSCARIAVQTGSDAAPQVVAARVFENLDIDVRASDTIAVSAEGAGTDSGTIHIAVTLIYA